MDAADLEGYEYQLAQVKQAYAQDPNNEELKTLKAELEDLIKLTKDLIKQSSAPSTSKAASSSAAAGSSSKAASSSSSGGQQPAKAQAEKPGAAASASTSSSSSSSSAKLKVGDECLAKYSDDGKFYPARIVSTSGSSNNPMFSVIFKGYDNTELVPAADVKAFSQEKKRQLQVSAEEEADKEKRRKKNAKKEATKLQKTEEQKGKQSAWQSFAKKSAKKGISIPGVKGESMFASPDNPYGKVGVVGSGRGMQSYNKMGKHIFEPEK